MGFDIARIPIEALAITGQPDEFAIAVLSDDGLVIEGTFSESAGISWADLARLLEHPYAKAMLEEAELLR